MHKHLKIIIADDHCVIRRGIKELLLAEYPFAHIEDVNDSGELMKKLIKHKWDMVISDIKMPGVNGIEATRQIKKLYPKLPVLIMSMFPESKYALQALEAGASCYLGKDTIHEHLIQATHKIMLDKRYLTPMVSAELISSLTEVRNRPIHETLSKREFEVFKLLTTGKTTNAIAQLLSVGTSTISTFRKRILTKMQMSSNASLIIYALENDLI